MINNNDELIRANNLWIKEKWDKVFEPKVTALLDQISSGCGDNFYCAVLLQRRVLEAALGALWVCMTDARYGDDPTLRNMTFPQFIERLMKYEIDVQLKYDERQKVIDALKGSSNGNPNP